MIVMERAPFYTAWRDKKLRNLFVTGAGASGTREVASRVRTGEMTAERVRLPSIKTGRCGDARAASLHMYNTTRCLILTCTVGLLSGFGQWDVLSVHRPHMPRPWNPT